MERPSVRWYRWGVRTCFALASLAAVVIVVTVGIGCPRANPRVDRITRTEGGAVVRTTFEYDAAGHVISVGRVVGEGEDAQEPEVTELTWTGDLLSQIVRTLTFDGFQNITTTVIEHDQDLLKSAVATSLDVIDGAGGEEPRERSTETFTIGYDKAQLESVDRSFEDADNNRSTTALLFTYDVVGLIEVRDDSAFENNGAPDLERSTVTTIEYVDGKPSKLSVSVDEGRPGTFDIRYKGGVLEDVGVATPALDEFNNEFIADGRLNYTFDSSERLDGAELESDIAETVTFEIEFIDDDEAGEAAGLDLMPAGALQLPLWDLRGNAYDGLDARTQVPRIVGASW